MPLFLQGSWGTSCDIIQFMSQGELIIETLTTNAEHESQNVWSFAFEVERKSLGHRSTSLESIFVGDHLKGQDPAKMIVCFILSRM
jgi:hypothetical protein